MIDVLGVSLCEYDGTGTSQAPLSNYVANPHAMNDRGEVFFRAILSSPSGSGLRAIEVLVRADPKPGTTPGSPIIPEDDDEIPSGGWNIRPEGFSPNCWWHSNSKPGSNRRGFTDSPKKPNWFSGFFIAEFCHLNTLSK
jgi:hypothetical protein